MPTIRVEITASFDDEVDRGLLLEETKDALVLHGARAVVAKVVEEQARITVWRHEDEAEGL